MKAAGANIILHVDSWKIFRVQKNPWDEACGSCSKVQLQLTAIFAWRNWTERKSLFWRVDFARNLMCGFDQRHFFAMVSTRVLGILVAGTTTCPGRESQDPCEYRSVLSCEENFSRINCCNVVLQSINSKKKLWLGKLLYWQPFSDRWLKLLCFSSSQCRKGALFWWLCAATIDPELFARVASLTSAAP